MKQTKTNILRTNALLAITTLSAAILSSCGGANAKMEMQAPPPPQLPVIIVTTSPATTYQDFASSLEGKVNVEIHPQVKGYIEKIFVDEGAYVTAGQPLFKLSPEVYSEQLNSANANLLAAQANAERAKVEIDRLQPLVDNNVISDVQLKTAKANYNAANAAIAQAKSMMGSAQINVGFTLIKAPVSGYIGRIPYKIGSLVGDNEKDPLTIISDVSEIYAYFSMSEQEFIAFKDKYTGSTIEEKLKQVPPVELVLADNSIFPQKGKIELIEGQFDKTIGAINFRASFPNAGGILRSGNTGKIRMPQLFSSVVLVPQEATFEIQDKTFVFTVGDSNKIVTKPITIGNKTTNYYFVSSGLNQGDKVVLASQSTMLMGGLRDGMPIVPQMVSMDSLLKAKPL